MDSFNVRCLLQVDFAVVKYVTKIATQCRGYNPDHANVHCVTSYTVNVKISEEATYTAVCGTDSCPQLFTGNSDTGNRDTVVTNDFDWPIAARFVRLYPQSWLHWMAMRWELYGCDSLN